MGMLERAYGRGGGKPITHGHLHVHKHEIELARHECLKCPFAVIHDRHLSIDLRKHHGRDPLIGDVIVR